MISIIIPTKDRASSIVSATQSIIEQTVDDIEVIVVDDASVDITPKILASARDKRIRVIRNDKSLGPAGAYLVGIKAAKGEYIAFQDSDDVSMPDRLERCLKEKADVVYHDIYSVIPHPDIGTLQYVSKKAQDWEPNRIYKEQYLPGIIFAKAKLLKKLTVPEKFRGAWDWWLHIWLHQQKATYAKVDAGLYFYFRHGAQQSVRNEMSGERQKSIKAIQRYLFEKKIVKKNHKFSEAFSWGKFYLSLVLDPNC